MRARNKFVAGAGAVALLAGGTVLATVAPASAVAPTGGCSSWFVTPGTPIDDTTPAASYLGTPLGAWSDEATTGIDPDYTLTSSGSTAVGGTRSFAITYDKGMKSFAAASGTAHWFFSVNGVMLPAVTEAMSLPAGVAAPGDTVTGSFTIAQGGNNTVAFEKLIFDTTAGVRVACSGQETGTATVNPHTTPVATNVTTSFQAFAVATATITSVSNQNVTTHARGGDTISFDGSDFSAAGTGTAELCDTDGSNCHATTSTFSIDANGDGSGSIAVPAGFVGAKALKLTSNGESGLKPITVLGAPTVAVNVAGGGAGTSVTVTGTNWDPAKAVSVGGYGAVPPIPPPATSDPAVSVTTGAGGAFSTTFVVNDPLTKYLGAQQAHAAAPIFASTAFTFSGDACTAKAGTATTGSCALLETVTLAVIAGDLKMSKDAGAVVLDPISLNGTAQTSTGSLRDVLVKDYRGGSLGWSLVGRFSGLSGPATIAPEKLSWTPSCTAAGNNDDTVTTGTGAAFTTASTDLPLCSVATTGLGADGVSGGDTAADAGLSLDLLANQAAGNYTGTLTLTLS